MTTGEPLALLKNVSISLLRFPGVEVRHRGVALWATRAGHHGRLLLVA